MAAGVIALPTIIQQVRLDTAGFNRGLRGVLSGLAKASRTSDEAGDSTERLGDETERVGAASSSAGRQVSGLGAAVRGARKDADQGTRSFSAWRTALEGSRKATDRHGNSVDVLRKRLTIAATAGLLFSASLKLLKIPAVITGIGLAASAVSALTAGVVGLAGSLGPLLGLVGAAPGLFFALGTSIGAVALSFGGVGDAVEAGNKAIEGFMDPKAAEEYAAALAKLTPEARSFVRALLALRGGLEETRRVGARALFPGLELGLSGAMRALPEFQGVVRQTGRVVGDLAAEAGAMFGSRVWRADIAVLGATNARFLERVGSAGLVTVDAFRHVTFAAQPLVEWIGKLSLKWAENFRETMAVKRATGELGEFFDRARFTAQQFGRVIGNLWGFFRGLFSAGGDFSRDMLTGLERMTDRWDRFANSVQGRNALTEWFDSARPILEAAGRLVRDLAQGFVDVSKRNGLVEVMDQFRVELLPVLVQLTDTVSAAFGPALITLVAEMAKAFALLAGSSGPLFAFVNVLTLFFETVGTLLETIPGLRQLVFLLVTFAGAVKAFSFLKFITGIGFFTTKIGGAVSALKAMRVAQLGAANAAVLQAAAQKQALASAVGVANAAKSIANTTAQTTAAGNMLGAGGVLGRFGAGVAALKTGLVTVAPFAAAAAAAVGGVTLAVKGTVSALEKTPPKIDEVTESLRQMHRESGAQSTLRLSGKTLELYGANWTRLAKNMRDVSGIGDPFQGRWTVNDKKKEIDALDKTLANMFRNKATRDEARRTFEEIIAAMKAEGVPMAVRQKNMDDYHAAVRAVRLEEEARRRQEEGWTPIDQESARVKLMNDLIAANHLYVRGADDVVLSTDQLTAAGHRVREMLSRVRETSADAMKGYKEAAEEFIGKKSVFDRVFAESTKVTPEVEDRTLEIERANLAVQEARESLAREAASKDHTTTSLRRAELAVREAESSLAAAQKAPEPEREARATVDGLLREFAEGQKKLDQFNADIASLTGRNYGELANYITSLGPQAASLLRDAVGKGPRELDALQEAFRKSGKMLLDPAIQEFQGKMDAMAAIAAAGGQQTAHQLAQNLGIGVADVKKVAAEYHNALVSSLNPLLEATGGKPLRLLATTGNVDTTSRQGERMGKTNLRAAATGTVMADSYRNAPRTEVGAGFVTGTPRAIVGEGSRHPEFVIPTDPTYRDRALGLFRQLGEQIGAFAGGGEVPRPRKKSRRIEEDDVPRTSPAGAALVDYVGTGEGHGVYGDGNVFDGLGWQRRRRRVRRVEEDQVPKTSPRGAELIDYVGVGPGHAVYADGSIYSGAGWTRVERKFTRPGSRESKSWEQQNAEKPNAPLGHGLDLFGMPVAGFTPEDASKVPDPKQPGFNIFGMPLSTGGVVSSFTEGGAVRETATRERRNREKFSVLGSRPFDPKEEREKNEGIRGVPVIGKAVKADDAVSRVRERVYDFVNPFAAGGTVDPWEEWAKQNARKTNVGQPGFDVFGMPVVGEMPAAAGLPPFSFTYEGALVLPGQPLPGVTPGQSEPSPEAPSHRRKPRRRSAGRKGSRERRPAATTSAKVSPARPTSVQSSPPAPSRPAPARPAAARASASAKPRGRAFFQPHLLTAERMAVGRQPTKSSYLRPRRRRSRAGSRGAVLAMAHGAPLVGELAEELGDEEAVDPLATWREVRKARPPVVARAAMPPEPWLNVFEDASWGYSGMYDPQAVPLSLTKTFGVKLSPDGKWEPTLTGEELERRSRRPKRLASEPRQPGDFREDWSPEVVSHVRGEEAPGTTPASSTPLGQHDWLPYDEYRKRLPESPGQHDWLPYDEYRKRLPMATGGVVPRMELGGVVAEALKTLPKPPDVLSTHGALVGGAGQGVMEAMWTSARNLIESLPAPTLAAGGVVPSETARRLPRAAVGGTLSQSIDPEELAKAIRRALEDVGGAGRSGPIIGEVHTSAGQSAHQLGAELAWRIA